ncbi:MAG: hypothetical protein H0U49_06485 [Parachlamydiaceae bacterium]|nr:hypothetical protein [Parachlamydiaceae bacterium]
MNAVYHLVGLGNVLDGFSDISQKQYSNAIKNFAIGSAKMLTGYVILNFTIGMFQEMTISKEERLINQIRDLCYEFSIKDNVHNNGIFDACLNLASMEMEKQLPAKLNLTDSRIADLWNLAKNYYKS